jgi:hypothetical protein
MTNPLISCLLLCKPLMRGLLLPYILKIWRMRP